MKVALVVHVYYADIWQQIFERLSKIKPFGDLFVTTSSSEDIAHLGELQNLGWNVEVVSCENNGWDIGPFLQLLPRLESDGYDIVCKLHTKKGKSGFAAEWREVFYRTLIRSDREIKTIISLFEKYDTLSVVGPADFYKSNSSHLFRNGPIVDAILSTMMDRKIAPSDWGFFCGTMFWSRVADLMPLAKAWVDLHASRKDSASLLAMVERDGHPAHGFERLFGLMPALVGKAIALVNTPYAEDAISWSLVAAPDRPSGENISTTLYNIRQSFVEREGSTGWPDMNPLIHYIETAGRENALDPNRFFASAWYLENNGDVQAAGINPLRHYMTSGVREQRAASPAFDTRFYLHANPDVAAVKTNPLLHFLQYGQKEGRIALPPKPAPVGWRSDAIWPSRVRDTFDLTREAAFLREIFKRSEAEASRADGEKVSIIMPTFNRADTIDAAITSVLNQTHGNFELLIVDDGSTDNTKEIVSAHLGDPRICFHEIDHEGVSAARNRGLELATGTVIAYLDSDNRWKPNFLSAIVAFMQRQHLDCAYASMELRGETGTVFGFRGDAFDWKACYKDNYIDLNVFCHRRELYDRYGGFDRLLRRMVDWDLILRYTKKSKVGHAPFIGCEYFDAKAGGDRITTSEPIAFRAMMRSKYDQNDDVVSDVPLFSSIRFSIAIKIAAPLENPEEWGDYHYAEALAEALRLRGHRVHVDLRENWYQRPASEEDVVICLRGIVRYKPRPNSINLLWIISHPDQISYDEIEQYRVCFVASFSHAALLSGIVRIPVHTLLQATDRSRFGAAATDPALTTDLLFVGNSRNEYRTMVRWAVESGAAVTVYGTRWEQFLPEDKIAGEHVENKILPNYYKNARIVLNDHWESMRDFGIMSNRLFDVVAAGGTVVSDHIPSIPAVFGAAVKTAKTAQEFSEHLKNPPKRKNKVALQKFLDLHDFKSRADVLMEAVKVELSPRGTAMSMPSLLKSKAPRVHLICPGGHKRWQSSAYIRLIAPLTWESARPLDLVLHDENEYEGVEKGDLCIVQRTAIHTTDDAERLLGKLRSKKVPLIIDNDDAFHLIDEAHPEFEKYSGRIKAFDLLLTNANLAWYSTDELARGVPHALRAKVHVVPNQLDPRLWRNYRRKPRTPWNKSKIKVLYMGTVTHQADFDFIMPALDAVADRLRQPLEVHVLGAVSKMPERRWLKRLPLPAGNNTYPRFVKWLTHESNFDVGLSPLVDNPFNAAKSDIKFLDYSALAMPSILSNVTAYRDSAKDREFAFLAENTTEDWVKSIISVIDKRYDLHTLGEAAFDYVWRERSVESLSTQQHALIDKLIK